jgi:hypothetical protein
VNILVKLMATASLAATGLALAQVSRQSPFLPSAPPRSETAHSQAPGPVASARSAASEPQIYVYEDRRTDVTEIFDLTRNILVVGGDDLQRNPAAAESEFSGPTLSCSNAQYHCLETALHVAIPKGQIPQSWSTSGLSCQGRPETTEGSDLFNIVCRVNGQDSSVSLSFSRRRGVISYSRACADCWPQEFVLIGRTGLFAEGALR